MDRSLVVWIFTARIRRMREGNSFSLCVSSLLDRGHPIQLMGVPPSQVWMGGVPHPTDGGYPLPRSGLGVLHPADRGYPFPGGGYPTWEGVPLAGGPPTSRGYPPPDQHSVYLLRGRRCASCVHAGGLSCLPFRWKVVWAMYTNVIRTRCSHTVLRRPSAPAAFFFPCIVHTVLVVYVGPVCNAPALVMAFVAKLAEMNKPSFI